MNQTKFVNSLALNSNLIFSNGTTTNSTDIQSPTSPQTPNIPTTIKASSSSSTQSMTIIPMQQLFMSKLSYVDDSISDDQQQQQQLQQQFHQQRSGSNINLKTNIINTHKLIKPPSSTSSIITTISSPTQQQSQPNQILIQTVNKKPIHNINLNQTPSNQTKQLNSITLTTVNTINTPTITQTTAVPSSFPSSSSRINLPITTLTPLQLTVTSTTTTPLINKITKCSNSSTTSSSTPTSSSSSSSSSLPTLTTSTNTLGSSAAAKLIFNGSLNNPNNSNSITDNNNNNTQPITLKLTAQQRPTTLTTAQQTIKTVSTPTTTVTTTAITNTIASPSTSIPKILFSTTPIQIHQNQVVAQTTPNLVITPRLIITATTTASGTSNSSNGINVTTTSNANSSNSTTNLIFQNNTPTQINLKSINSKLNDTLNKPIYIENKLNTNNNNSTNFIKTTLIPQQQPRTVLNPNIIDSQIAIEAAKSSLLNLQNSITRGQTTQLFSTQRLNSNNIVKISQQPILASTTTTTTTTPVTTPTNTLSTITFNNNPLTSTQATSINLAQTLLASATSKPNIIRKKKSKNDLFDQSNASSRTESPTYEIIQSSITDNNNNNQTVPTNDNIEFTSTITNNNNNNKNEIIKLQTTNYASITSNLLKNPTKTIVNVTKHNSLVESNEQAISTYQQISTLPLQIQQSQVCDLLNPSNIMQQPAIIHIPCNLTSSSSVDTATSILGTFLHPSNEVSISSSFVQQINDLHASTQTIKTSPLSDTFTNSVASTITTTKKRRINEFETTNNLNNLENESKICVVDDSSTGPPQKLPRLYDTKTKYKKTKDLIKSVDNLENIDLNVNKCTINVLDDETVKNLSKEFVYYDNYGIKWISKNSKQNSITLMKYYKPSWKTRFNHFTRYSDIKIKEETKSINELTIEKERLKGLNEWTFHYVISQFKELMNIENDSLNLMNEIENLIKSRTNVNDKKIFEAIKANTQRHVYIKEQFKEAHVLVENLIKNKNKFIEILNRNPSSSSLSSKQIKHSTTNHNNNNSININQKTNKTKCKSPKNTSKFFKNVKNGSNSKALIKSKIKTKE